MNTFLLKWIRRAGASVMFTGYFPIAPGTMGSGLMLAAIWYLNRKHPSFFTPEHAILFLLTSFALTAISAWLSADAQYVFGKRDPKQVIIDECAGQFVTFLLVPISIRTLILGFALFRFFDVVKPFPIHNFEEIEGGVGITMDDIAAGVLSCVSIHVIIIAYHGIMAWLT